MTLCMNICCQSRAWEQGLGNVIIKAKPGVAFKYLRGGWRCGVRLKTIINQIIKIFVVGKIIKYQSSFYRFGVPCCDKLRN